MKRYTKYLPIKILSLSYQLPTQKKLSTIKYSFSLIPRKKKTRQRNSVKQNDKHKVHVVIIVVESHSTEKKMVYVCHVKLVHQ